MRCSACLKKENVIITFFIWNLMVALTSSIFCVMDSWCDRRPGNLPALFRPGPRRRGICLIRDSDARKASNLAIKEKISSFKTFSTEGPLSAFHSRQVENTRKCLKHVPAKNVSKYSLNYRLTCTTMNNLCTFSL